MRELFLSSDWGGRADRLHPLREVPSDDDTSLDGKEVSNGAEIGGLPWGNRWLKQWRPGVETIEYTASMHTASWWWCNQSNVLLVTQRNMLRWFCDDLCNIGRILQRTVLSILVYTRTPSVCGARYRASPEEQLLKAFQVLDADSKGYLTQEELTKAMTEEGEWWWH